MDKNKRERARYLMGDEVSQAVTDETLDFNFDLVESEVLTYCNRLDFPPGLMLIVIKIVAEYTQAAYYDEKLREERAKPENQTTGSISSISRGDTTISYGDNARVTEYGSPRAFLHAVDFVGNYTSQLKKYRKLRTL